jgi:hypothetical protein
MMLLWFCRIWDVGKNCMDELVLGEEILRRRTRPFCILTLNARFGGLLILPILTLGLLCCGCIPLKFTTSPGARGTVVDASTHSALSGAEVAISRSTYPPESADKAFENARSPVVMSQETGGFSVPPERRLDLYFVPVDAFPRFGLLVVKCRGYETTCIPFWSRSVADLGEVQIRSGPVTK